MPQKLRSVLGILLLLTGLLLFSWPDLTACCRQWEVRASVTAFENTRASTADPGSVSDTCQGNEGEPSDTEWQEVAAYNEGLVRSGQAELCDAWSCTQSPEGLDWSEDDVFGYLDVPALGQTFPIYLGASSAHLREGVAVLGHTSIPIGGPDTNSVIAGHRGYNRSRTFFKDIEDLQIGDTVTVINRWADLEYRVTAIDIIEPYDIDAVKIVPGHDRITLMTCHPYQSHGRYRYLVICDRVTEEEEPIPAEQEAPHTDTLTASDGTVYPLSRTLIRSERHLRLLLSGLFVCLIPFSIFITHRKRKRGESHA